MRTTLAISDDVLAAAIEIAREQNKEDYNLDKSWTRFRFGWTGRRYFENQNYAGDARSGKKGL
jgi:hypothetical protein